MGVWLFPFWSALYADCFLIPQSQLCRHKLSALQPFLIKEMWDTDDLSPLVGHCAAFLNIALTQTHTQSVPTENDAELQEKIGSFGFCLHVHILAHLTLINIFDCLNLFCTISTNFIWSYIDLTVCMLFGYSCMVCALCVFLPETKTGSSVACGNGDVGCT